MSDCASAPPLWMPDWGDAPKGVRHVLLTMWAWMDGRGSCDASEEEFAAFTGYEVKAVGRHLKWALDNGWVSRSERRRLGNGQLTGYRWWASEKLKGLGASGIAPSVASQAAEPVDNPGGEPPDNLSVGGQSVREPQDNLSATTGHSVPKPQDNLSATDKKSGGSIEVRGRARARLSLSSIFLSFAFRDDDQKVIMGVLLDVCGIGLKPLEDAPELLDSLAEMIDVWTGEGFDPDADIAPTLKRLTGYRRVQPIYTFRAPFITDELRQTRDARVAKAEKAARSAGGGKPSAENGKRGAPDLVDRNIAKAAGMGDAEKRAQRIAILDKAVSMFDRATGEDGDETELLVLKFELPMRDRHLTGEWLIDALRPIIEGKRVELAVLRAESGNGGGNG